MFVSDYLGVEGKDFLSYTAMEKSDPSESDPCFLI